MRHPNVRSFCQALESWQPAKPASRLQVPAQRPTAPPRRPSLTTASASKINWSLWKNCAVISFLLIAIHFSWTALQKKRELIGEQAKITQEQQAKPTDPSLQTETRIEPTTVAISSRY